MLQKGREGDGGHPKDAGAGGEELPPARRTGSPDGGRGGRRVHQR